MKYRWRVMSLRGPFVFFLVGGIHISSLGLVHPQPKIFIKKWGKLADPKAALRCQAAEPGLAQRAGASPTERCFTGGPGIASGRRVSKATLQPLVF